MRILSLGYPLPNPQIDNCSFASAPCFFDYDAMVVDPEALSRLIEEIVDQTAEHATAERQPVVNGATGPIATGLADLLRRRQEETARLLANGGCVVCIIRPDVVHHRVSGFSGCDRYFWLPAPAGLQYRESHLMAGRGESVLVTDHDHPFATYVESFRERLAYSAYFAAGIPGFESWASVFARSAGGAAIGVDLRVDAGRVVFIPHVRDLAVGANRHPVASSIVDCLRRLRGQTVEESPPAWVTDFTLPGLAELEAKQAAAEEELATAQTKAAETRARLDEIARFRRLLWQEGKYGLEAAARDAFAALGCQVSDDLDEPCVVYRGSERLHLEAEGSPAAVGMEAHYRLRRRLEEAIAAGRPQKGVVLVNGYRLNRPGSRDVEYADALRVASESMRYCLLTASQLFDVLRRHLDGDGQIAQDFWQRLLSCEGIFDAGGLSSDAQPS
jgi:hypothetical protein